MNILVIDDHLLIHELLGAIATREFPEAEIHFASNIVEAIAIARARGRIDVAMLDLGLPDCVGIDALKRFKEECPGTAVLIVSASEERETVLKALRAGAAGYVPKTAKRQTVAGALRLVATGEIYVPPIAVGDILARDAQGPGRITDRQRTVMRLVLKGMANKEIARELDISENTVKQHLQSLYAYLGVSSRAQAVHVASRGQLRFD